ncbi:MAG: hypothetical protein M1816_006099 [Peltula sp. TS41687]|nr:MAG: hypothetical protein M1816_006099 [Peltula sp. TS41687]
MTSADQQLLYMISSIADSIDRQIDNVAAGLRDSLSSYKWIQDTILPPSPSPARIRKPPPSPPRFHDLVYTWLTRHKILVAAVLVSLGTGGWYVYRRRRESRKRRRARRASNGARKEVVVIAAGSPNEPICRSISLDLERRGFIVYVVVNSLEEEQMVHNESRMDVRPLNLDITDPPSTQSALERFHKYLITPQQAFLGADPHHLSLTGVVIIPETTYSAGAISTLGPETWSDALNAKVLGTVATVQALLPLIQDTACRTLMLTPNIISSLCLPHHSLETTIVAALEAFTRSLQAEGIQTTHLRLGSFDYGLFKPHNGTQHQQQQQQQPNPAPRAGATARPFLPDGTGGNMQKNESQPVRGSPLRELHVAVYDALTGPRTARVRHVGRGSLTYDLLGRLASNGLVGWMMERSRIRMRTDLDGVAVYGWL